MVVLQLKSDRPWLIWKRGEKNQDQAFNLVPSESVLPGPQPDVGRLRPFVFPAVLVGLVVLGGCFILSGDSALEGSDAPP